MNESYLLAMFPISGRSGLLPPSLGAKAHGSKSLCKKPACVLHCPSYLCNSLTTWVMNLKRGSERVTHISWQHSGLWLSVTRTCRRMKEKPPLNEVLAALLTSSHFLYKPTFSMKLFFSPQTYVLFQSTRMSHSFKLYTSETLLSTSSIADNIEGNSFSVFLTTSQICNKRRERRILQYPSFKRLFFKMQERRKLLGPLHQR